MGYVSFGDLLDLLSSAAGGCDTGALENFRYFHSHSEEKSENDGDEQ